MATEVERIARSWIGTPYVHQASLKGAGCDCLGLLRGVWRELRGEEPEAAPPYSPDWAEARSEETLYRALSRHLREVPLGELAPGDVALFRMMRHGPAKHCGIIGALKQRSVSALENPQSLLCATASLHERSHSGATASLHERRLTLIHARQNHRVAEEPFTPFWSRNLAFAFRL